MVPKLIWPSIPSRVSSLCFLLEPILSSVLKRKDSEIVFKKSMRHFFIQNPGLINLLNINRNFLKGFKNYNFLKHTCFMSDIKTNIKILYLLFLLIFIDFSGVSAINQGFPIFLYFYKCQRTEPFEVTCFYD